MAHLACVVAAALRRPDAASPAVRGRHACAGAAEAAPTTPPVPTALEPWRSREKKRVELARWQQDALHAFWQAQGVRSVAHRDKLVALGSDMLLFRSPHDLSVRLTALRQALWHAAGIHDADVGRMVGRYPRVVCGDVAASVTSKLQALSAGLPGTDLQRLVEANPQLLSLDPEVTVVRRAQLLARLLPHNDILRMCELHPALLTVSVERTAAPALAVLTNVLEMHGAQPGTNTSHLVAQAAPRLLTTAPATLRARAAQLERSAPGTIASMQDRPSGLGRLLCASERALHRIAFVRATAPDAGAALSPGRIVSMPTARFTQHFPGFDAWLNRAGLDPASP